MPRVPVSARSAACLTIVSMCVLASVAVAGHTRPAITTSTAQPDTQKDAVTNDVVRDLCGRQIVLLGESPTHGFGKSMQFKADLVRELVDGCHFNAVLFESGIYDFLNIQAQIASGRTVDGAAVAAAIGGLWANADVEPLVSFLLDKARRGQVVLGGIDDQIGSGTWAQHQMPAELVQHLGGADRARCLAVLQRHMLWQYRDDSPYGPKARDEIVGCLHEVESRLGQETAAAVPSRQAHLAMLASLDRQFGRDFMPDPAGVDAATASFNARDASMYKNFRWLVSRLPAGSKVVVWTATVHAAKESRGVSGFEGRVPFGKLLQTDAGDRPFSLFLSAATGSYARVRQPIQQLGPVPDGSLEQKTFAAGGDARYYSRTALHEFGAIAGRALGTGFKTARWDELCDGMVIFREERPPDGAK